MFSKQAHSKIALPFCRIASVLAPGLLALLIAHSAYKINRLLVEPEGDFSSIPGNLPIEIYLIGIYLGLFSFLLLFAEIFHSVDGSFIGHKILLVIQLITLLPACSVWMYPGDSWDFDQHPAYHQIEKNANVALCSILCLHIAAYFLMNYLAKLGKLSNDDAKFQSQEPTHSESS